MRLESERPGALECASETFVAMCKHADPWACSMLAFNLSRGIGIKRDLARALEVLPGGCRFGREDPACKAAFKVKTEIEAARGRRRRVGN